MPNGFPSTKSVQLAALRAVIDPDLYADFRKICRWFSKTFSTPLTAVYDLPSDFVLQHYLEDRYEQMEHNARRNLLIELTETPEERIERLRQEAEEDHKSYTRTQSTLDTVMAKISKMRNSDIKSSLEIYRTELAEKAAAKEAVRNEKPPSREDIAQILANAGERATSGPMILPTEPSSRTPPPEYPDFELKIDESELDGIDLDADSISLPKKK